MVSRQKVVLEDGVADGDEDGAADGLGGDDGGGADGYLFERKGGLHGGKALLDCHADASGREEFIANPHCSACCGLKGSDEAAADRPNSRSENGGGCEEAVFGNEDAGEHAEEGVGGHVGNHVDAGG